jgi:hypothetical protein
MTLIRHLFMTAALCSIVACGSSTEISSNTDASSDNPNSSTTGSSPFGTSGDNSASCSVEGSPKLYSFYAVQNSAGPGAPVGEQTLAVIFSSDPNYCSAFGQGILGGSTLYTVEAPRGTAGLVNAQVAVTVSHQQIPTSGDQCLQQRPRNTAGYSPVNGTLTTKISTAERTISVSVDVPQSGSTAPFTLTGTATRCDASSYPAIGGTADSSNGAFPCRSGGGNTPGLYSFYSLQDSAGPGSDPNEQTLAVVFSSDANYCTGLSSGVLANSTLYTAITPRGTTALANADLSVYFVPQVIAASGQTCLETKPQSHTYANSTQAAVMNSQTGSATGTLNVTLNVPQEGNTAALTLQGVASNCPNAVYPAVGGSADSNNGGLPCRSD